MKKVLLGAALIGAVVVGTAQAQVPADRSVKFRQSHFVVLGGAVGRIDAHIKGTRALDPAALQASAIVADQMAQFVFNGFLQGTEQAAPTRAKPEIWKEWDKFKKLESDMQGATAKLVEASRSNDAKALQAAFGGVGQSCKACHDVYRTQ
ncbi:MAG: c-type cytochrome [Burkholderiales bacterium]